MERPMSDTASETIPAGSWRVGKPAFRSCAFTIYSGPEIDGGGIFEAHIVGCSDFITSAVRNRAAIIAAAPDLLAALKELIEACDDEALNDRDDDAYSAALDRQSIAMQAAQKAINAAQVAA
jgi:hypothetical protein